MCHSGGTLVSLMKAFFKKFRETWLGRGVALFLLWCLSVFIRGWRASLRVKVVDHSGLLATGEARGMLGIFWHNRLVFLPAFFPRSVREHTAAITSPSRDGEYADILVRQFLGDTVRGSSSRGGGKAVIKCKHLLDSEWNVCIAGDGPRGPKYSMQPGVALLAKRCQAPVLPININSPSRWQTKTWDQLQFPKPFSRVEFVIGKPIFIAKDCDVRTEACQKIRDSLLAITDDRRKD